MKRGLVTLALIFAFFLLQTTVFHHLQIASVKPNLLLILTVSLGFLQGRRTGLVVGFLSGLLIDLFYGSFFGFYALILMYIGYVSGRLCNIYFEDNIRVPLLLTMGGELFYGVAVYVVHFFLRGRVQFFRYLGRVIFPELVYTALLAILVYRILYRIDKALSTNERKGIKNAWL